jgi:hypothetical protein
MKRYTITRNWDDGTVFSPDNSDLGQSKKWCLGWLKGYRIPGNKYTLWRKQGNDYSWEILKRDI